jgi:hypothetical protein
MTYLPSLYGPSKFKFFVNEHFFLADSENRWHQVISQKYAIFSLHTFLNV